jgi:hypothetical protein
MTPAERLFKERVERVFPERRVIISRGLFARRPPEKGEALSRISSTASTLRAAQQTGRLTLRSGAVVARVLVAADGTRATGVEFVDGETGRTEEARGKLVFLCASTLESVRILMNSRSAAHPEGIGASSGVLGRYVMDHSAGNVYFYLPEVPDTGGPFELLGSDSIMIPRYQNLGARREPYLRGFGLWGGIQRLPVPNFLRRHRDVAFGFLCARSETLPHRDNRVEIDPTLKDAWGIPAAHIVCEWKDEDLALARAARAAAREIVEAGGGRCAEVTELFYTPFVKDTSKGCRRSGRSPLRGCSCTRWAAPGWAWIGARRCSTSCRSWDVEPVRHRRACWPTSGGRIRRSPRWRSPPALDHAASNSGGFRESRAGQDQRPTRALAAGSRGHRAPAPADDREPGPGTRIHAAQAITSVSLGSAPHQRVRPAAQQSIKDAC